MIPILQKVFSKDIKLEEFSLFLLEKGRINRLNTNKSLLDCKFQGQEQLLMVPLSLQFRRKYADTVSACQKEGVLEKMSVHGGSLTGKKTRHFVLTEGYLFYYKKKGDATPAGAVALEYHSMRKMVIKTEQTDSLLLKRTFYGFKTKAAEMFVLRGSEPDLVTWRDALKSHVMNMARRTFGEALAEGDSLPPVVAACLDYLRPRLECEGLFRISGSAALVEYYKDKFDQGMDVDLSACEDPHIVASLLKMWFRELPEPVIPFSLYDPLTKRDLAGEAWAAFLLEQVKALPRLNFLVLRSLLLFLAEVASREAQNKMSAANLATCFGPNLMWPAEDDQTNMVADTPLVMATTVDLIRLASRLPASAPPPRPANKKPKLTEIQQSRPPGGARPAVETSSEPAKPEAKPEAKEEAKGEAVPPPPADQVKPPTSQAPGSDASPEPAALQASVSTEASDDYQGKVARTLYDFADAADPRKLPFREGELILILEKGPPGWWAAEKNGERGFVAEGYFELLGEEQTEAPEEDADLQLQVSDLRRELKDQRRKTEALQHLVTQLVSRLESLEAQVAAGAARQSPPAEIQPAAGTDKLAVGARVTVRGKEAELGPGTLRYLGPLHSREGRWAGIELEKPLGRNDGSVDDRRYFTCKSQFGVFVPISGVDVVK